MNPALSRWSFLLALAWMTAALSPAFAQNSSHGPIPKLPPSGGAANPAQLQQLAERFREARLQSLRDNPQVLDDLRDAAKRKDLEEQLHALIEAVEKGRLQLQPNEPFVEELTKQLQQPGQSSQNSLDPDLVGQLNGILVKARSQGAGSAHNQSDVSQATGDSDRNGPPDPLPEPPLLDQPSQPKTWLMRQVGKWVETNPALQKSPALRRAMDDLAQRRLQGHSDVAGNSDMPLGEKTAEWIADHLPTRQFWTDSVIPKIRDIPLPALPNIDLPHAHFPAPSLPSLNVPTVNMPAPSSSQGETIFLSVFTAAVVGLVLWRLYSGMLNRRRQKQGPNWAEGDPASAGHRSLDLSLLKSREDLIRAFEQLSLVKLGSGARSWNHLHLAAGLGGKLNEHRQLANHLAFLYEQARYAPGDGSLSPDALRIAHRELAILAGVAKA
jgi:hypothetical protein